MRINIFSSSHNDRVSWIAQLLTIIASVRLVTGLEKDDSPQLLPQCSHLLLGQYRCVHEPTVQYPMHVSSRDDACQPDNSLIVLCELSEGVDCRGLIDNVSRNFEKRLPLACAHASGTDFTTTLLLSIFLGWLGIDRIYLGYYAIGVLKMFSLGAFFVLYLADVVLIALQLLLPADGSAYEMSRYGPRAIPVRFNNETVFASAVLQ